MPRLRGFWQLQPPCVDGLTGVIDQVRPGVRRRQAQPLREAVLVAGLQGMVDGVGVGRDHADPGVAVVRAPRLNVTRPGLGLVEVLQAGIDVRALAAHPAGFQHIVVGEFARHLKVEVLDVGVAPLAVRRHGDHVEDGSGRIDLRWNRILNRGRGDSWRD